jgi:two-component system, response regulator
MKRKMDKKVILLVEDNPDDVNLTLRAFRKNSIGNEIIVAEDGAEALEYLFGTGKYQGKDGREMPQVILLDLKLPEVDGLEVLRRLRDDERTRLLPVVILTSSKEETDLLRGNDFGGTCHLMKPLDFNQFVECAKQLDLSWMVLKRPFSEETG